MKLEVITPPDSKNDATRLRLKGVLLLIATVTLTALSTSGFLSYISTQLATNHTTLHHNIMSMNSELTKFHLQLDEISHSDGALLDEDVWVHLENARGHIDHVLRHERLNTSSLIDVDDKQIFTNLQKILRGIKNTEVYAKQYFNAFGNDEKLHLAHIAFDEHYEKLNRLNAKTQKLFMKMTFEEAVAYEKIAWVAILFTLFVAVILSIIFYRVEKKRVQAVQEAENSELRTRKILETAIDGIITVDEKGIIQEFNPAAETIFKYTAKEIIGKNVSLLMPDAHAKAHDGHMLRERQSTDSTVIGINRELVGKRKDGSVFPMDLSLSETELSNNYYYTGIVRDISERKQIEEEALRFGRILDSSWNEIYIFDADSLRFAKVSHGVEVNTGYTEKELCELTAFDIKPEYSERQFREMIEPLRQGETQLLTFKTHHRRKDGSTYPVEIRLQYAHSENKPLFVAVVQDITERIKAEEYIQELSRFPEETINPVLKVGGDGVITYSNLPASVVRESWKSDVDKIVPSHVLTLIKHSIENNTQQEMEVNCDGEVYLLVFSPVPEFDAVYVYGRNITQHKKDQAELISHREHLEEMVNVRTKELASARNEAEQANKAKSQFLANMSHEIRTPLSAILGFAENLKEPDNSAAENRKAIDTIIRSSKHLSGIINDILDLSKIEANSIDAEHIPFSLKEILYDLSVLMEPQAKNKGLSFRIEYVTPIPANISGDPVRLKQILINLCSNALKFTSEGAIKILASYEASDRYVTFTVVDSGIGMTDSQLGRLFKPFSQADSSTTRKYGGTGLGLALSRQLAELLGGSLDVKSEPGIGSQFILTLPVGEMESELTTDTVQHERDPVKSVNKTLKGKVLLAEDTPALQNLIGLHLKKIGFDYTIVENGLQAVEAAAENNFDLIFMDMQMPVMGGIEAVEILRKKGVSVPIIALTANVLLEEKTACLDAGCNQFVTKPVSRQELYEVAESFLQPIDVDNKEISPVISDVLDDDPDMISLVRKYVATLKDSIVQIVFHAEQQNLDELRSKINHLHATGGSYGYPFLSELARKVDDALEANDWNVTNILVTDIRKYCKRIYAGLEEQ